MKSKLTIHDIAARAGVSPSTVSRVLNGSKPVAPDKQAAVLHVIDELKYRPNQAAQGLARGKSNAVGVITQAITSPFYAELLYGIERGLHGSRYHPVFTSGNWNADQGAEALEVLIDRGVDALIVLGGRVPAERLLEIARQMPLVVVGRAIAGLEPYCLSVNNIQGAYTATRYLIELGHTRIAHITGDLTHLDAFERKEGYTRACAEMGIEIDPGLIVEGNFQEQSGLLAMDALLARGALFTAVFVANDQMAYGAQLALFRRGIRIPEDVSIVGFDDQPGGAYTTPPLTTVRQPTIEMGSAAAEAVMHLLAGEPVSLPTFSTELVIRESAARQRWSISANTRVLGTS
ncbi:MAG: substrate-binding domain-containing protein [Anaerolineae bacterium]